MSTGLWRCLHIQAWGYGPFLIYLIQTLNLIHAQLQLTDFSDEIEEIPSVDNFIPPIDLLRPAHYSGSHVAPSTAEDVMDLDVPDNVADYRLYQVWILFFHWLSS